MLQKILFLSFFFISFQVFSGEINSFDLFLNILGTLESNNNDYGIGDSGRSISRYQIQRACYEDARKYDKTIKFSYGSLTNKNNADKIVKAYCMKYEKQACLNNDYEILARLWNSGPDWRKKKSKTNKYWQKFSNLARQKK